MDCSSPYAMASLIGLKDKLRHRLRQRLRLRPPRHRHPERRAHEPQPLPRRGHLVPLPAPARLAPEAAVGKTLVSVEHDRPRRRRARPQARRGAGGLQVVRRRAAGWQLRLRRRGERRRLVPAPGRPVWTTDKDGIILDPWRPKSPPSSVATPARSTSS